MTGDQTRKERLFHAAVEMADPERRRAFLEAECGEDTALRNEIEEMLKHDRDSFLKQPAVDRPPDTMEHVPVREGPGSRIGPYRLMEQIGEGGFGLVFVAEQQEPMRRKVALKVIKPGMDSLQVIARFEAERQALALMDHPHIAKVLDAGQTDTGRPYFVMELVRGIPITEYCDRNLLTPHERLALFVSVCRAVQHAHQKGVIHRDIKPSNVLVTSHDGKPVAKVIDFGVAKAINQHLTERTIYTNFAQMIGTPLYMSPEQAEMSGLDIDTRSDIYSLGVLLYELLTGTTPFDKQRLRQAAFDEIRRIIREEEPPRPSTRLSQSGSTLPTVAAQRKTEPARLSKLTSGDLDWITMKALEKDRTRRYETADGLARDVERYLIDEPIEARPPSPGYRIGKFLRRNRTRVLAASLVLIALVGGMAGTTWGLLRARNEMRIAEQAAALERQARESEAVQRQLAVANEKTAVAKSRIAQAVRTFLQRDLLRQADAIEQAKALRQLGRTSEVKENPTIKELLDRAAGELEPAKIEAKFPGQPEVQASILRTLGDAYRSTGEFARATELLTRSSDIARRNLGHEDQETLATQYSLALAYLAEGKTERATELFKQVADVQARTLGADHPDTLSTMSGLAWAYLDAGKLAQAVELYEQVRRGQEKKLGPDHPDTLNTMHYLAGAYLYSGKTGRAIELYEPVRAARIKKLGVDDPETLATLNNLAVAYQDAGKLPQAIEMLELVRQARLRQLGPNHPDTMSTLNFLATSYLAVGQPDKALPLVRQIADALEKRSFQHQYAGAIVADLIKCYKALNLPAEAESIRHKWQAAVKGRENVTSPKKNAGKQ